MFIICCIVAIRKYIQFRTRQNKTLFDNLHSAACKTNQLPCKDPNSRSLNSERSERAPVDRSVCLHTNVRDTALSQLTNGYLTPVSARMSPNTPCISVVDTGGGTPSNINIIYRSPKTTFRPGFSMHS